MTRDMGIGGVFHGAIELFGHQIRGVEWSYGYCSSGSGVYECAARMNSMYTFRETVDLGFSHLSYKELLGLLSVLKQRWPGRKYELLSHNCCHFCEDFCKELRCKPPPAWLNRFAQRADATVKFTNDAQALALRLRTQVSIAASSSRTWIMDSFSRNRPSSDQPTESTSRSTDDFYNPCSGPGVSRDDINDAYSSSDESDYDNSNDANDPFNFNFLNDGATGPEIIDIARSDAFVPSSHDRTSDDSISHFSVNKDNKNEAISAESRNVTTFASFLGLLGPQPAITSISTENNKANEDDEDASQCAVNNNATNNIPSVQKETSSATSAAFSSLLERAKNSKWNFTASSSTQRSSVEGNNQSDDESQSNSKPLDTELDASAPPLPLREEPSLMSIFLANLQGGSSRPSTATLTAGRVAGAFQGLLTRGAGDRTESSLRVSDVMGGQQETRGEERESENQGKRQEAQTCIANEDEKVKRSNNAQAEKSASLAISAEDIADATLLLQDFGATNPPASVSSSRIVISEQKDESLLSFLDLKAMGSTDVAMDNTHFQKRILPSNEGLVPVSNMHFIADESIAAPSTPFITEDLLQLGASVSVCAPCLPSGGATPFTDLL
eukprot:CAMPEP_0175075394 /NCGR_PEP_ID=MMETSP0052_2-20121109/21972_1 /TAXON_ID=51329 ORGANISM="Polytomella parva, Strain SAG 63-3" /NCGR_SAMPLE_ID=MMETSP0052_2 /ASSEMBLY_ACC=CAM_ASM_000194 /LENGTH=612 /DNA_ID=CAMNT_0016344067 /DNA_START=306 /DNA_END=2144 /DNA_ORIENTATION=-